MFITFEGLDGVGKTTQANLLHNYLVKNGIRSILTKEPGGGGDFSMAIRSLLIGSDSLSELSELFAIYAARNEHIKNVIMPALKNNIVVICDRFIDSSIAYYCFDKNYQDSKSKSRELISTLQNAVGGLMPDITFLIDINNEVASKRISVREHISDKYDNFASEKKDKIRNTYLHLASADQDRIKVIDGSGNESDVFTAIIKHISDFSKFLI